MAGTTGTSTVSPFPPATRQTRAYPLSAAPVELMTGMPPHASVAAPTITSGIVRSFALKATGFATGTSLTFIPPLA